VISPAALQLLDVRDLEPPEPLTTILSALEVLPAQQALKVRHRREPFPLYPLLDNMGYDHRCSMIGTDDYRIYIWTSGQQQLERLCATAIAAEQRV
tara:strand:- start:293 stop:580 length:288 start_codon:yes stop_codon:yes gene_type:complete